MAVGYARPLRDFMMDLALGPTTKQWLDLVRPALRHLKAGAAELHQHKLAQALSEFERKVEAAARARGSSVDGGERDALNAQYDALVRALPKAFELTGERGRREPVVIHHLLRQIPGIQQTTIDRLQEGGLTSLNILSSARPDDLMAIAGVTREQADAIHRHLDDYLQDRTRRPMSPGGSAANERLDAALEKLMDAQARFQRAEEAEDRPAKREARRQRRAGALHVNVLLAELGAVDLVTEIERTDTPRKVDRIRRYIEESRNATHP